MGKKLSANRSICCNVQECKNHCHSDDYCSLNSVKIGANKPVATQCDSVDCKSFVAKQ